MNKLKIQSTVNPDKRYSFNEWIAKVMEAKENISHLQSPIIRERAAQRWNERNKRYYNVMRLGGRFNAAKPLL